MIVINAIIYGASGSGKTVNSTLVKGKTLLVCTDNSSIVLRNFERPELEIVNVSCVKEFLDAYRNGYKSKKYENIILDNLSDFFDLYVLEMDASGKYKDMRQAYLIIYQNLKRLTRESTSCGCNTIFTAWHDSFEVTQNDGTKIMRIQPKIPMKILDNICGLANIVAYVTTKKDEKGNKHWYYITEGSKQLLAKDQLMCRKFCKPEELFG